MTGFPQAARRELLDPQLRHNLRKATHAIRDKRARAIAELEDWEQLREAGRRIKERALRHLDVHLEASSGRGRRGRERPLGSRWHHGKRCGRRADQGHGKSRGRQGLVAHD